MDGRRLRWGSIEERFLASFTKGKKDECWNWNNSVDSSGYGQVKEFGKIHKAHRFSYTHYVGKIPDGLCVLHSCDNPRCVNPNHLWLGTKADNSRDMIEKGRDNFKCSKGATDPAKGEDNGMAILTEELVIWIRQVYKPRHPKFGQSALGRHLGMSQANIHRIITRKLWSHVD